MFDSRSLADPQHGSTVAARKHRAHVVTAMHRFNAKRKLKAGIRAVISTSRLRGLAQVSRPASSVGIEAVIESAQPQASTGPASGPEATNEVATPSEPASQPHISSDVPPGQAIAAAAAHAEVSAATIPSPAAPSPATRSKRAKAATPVDASSTPDSSSSGGQRKRRK